MSKDIPNDIIPEDPRRAEVTGPTSQAQVEKLSDEQLRRELARNQQDYYALIAAARGRIEDDALAGYQRSNPIPDSGERVRGVVYDTLRNYRLSNMTFESTDDPFCLVDLVSTIGGDISTGEAELFLLADEIVFALNPAPASVEPDTEAKARVLAELAGLEFDAYWLKQAENLSWPEVADRMMGALRATRNHVEELAPASVEVTGDWVLVPREPTREMMVASLGWREYDCPERYEGARQYYGAYRAMLAAAPASPTHPEPQVEPVASFSDEQVRHMVSRFLGWQFPEDFNPDGAIIYETHTPMGSPTTRPIGTNLLDYTQAKEMVLHMLADLPQGKTVDEAAVQVTEEIAVAWRRPNVDRAWGINYGWFYSDKPTGLSDEQALCLASGTAVPFDVAVERAFQAAEIALRGTSSDIGRGELERVIIAALTAALRKEGGNGTG